MKKLIVSFLFITLTVVGFSQSLFKPVPDNLFTTNAWALRKDITPSVWLWRFSAVVTATELTYDKASKEFISAPLSSVGPAIGFRHFTALSDGSPYNDWGVNAALLLGTDINNVELASMKAALLVNAFKFVNVGGVYTFNNVNHWGILIGASVNF